MKTPPHEDCPNKPGRYDSYAYRHATTLTLYVRDSKTRQMKAVGMLCRRCGAVKREGWPGWIIASPVHFFS